MKEIRRSALLALPAQTMFNLVDDVESYPAFLPWCGGSRVLQREPGRTVASIDIRYAGLNHSFTTDNRNQPPSAIDISLVSGPFQALSGGWRFTALTPEATRVELALRYEFSSRLLERVLGPVFDQIAGSMVDAFVRRAEALAKP